MIDLKNIYSLSDFQRKTREHIRRLKRSGQPAVLTVNGKAQLVVQDAGSYQSLLDSLEHAEALAGIRRGLSSVEAGEGRAGSEVLAEVRKRHGIPPNA